MTLREYIQKIGDQAFAQKFNCSKRAAAAYRLHERYPRPELAQRIVRHTRVTWEGIYGEESLSRARTELTA
jgi:hypothetical protein